VNSAEVNDEYYLWRALLTSEGGSAVLSDIPSQLENSAISLNAGRKIENPLLGELRIHRIETETGPLNDYIRTYGKWGLIVSNRLKVVLDQAGIVNIDWYPLIIVDEIYKSEQFFWCGNIIGVLDCIDRGKTIFDEDELFRKMWIDPIATHGAKLFRLSGHEEIHILIHQDLKEAIESSGCEGINFVPANGFCDPEADPLEVEDDGDEEEYVPWV
jgi:hypothetical protein